MRPLRAIAELIAPATSGPYLAVRRKPSGSLRNVFTMFLNKIPQTLAISQTLAIATDSTDVKAGPLVPQLLQNTIVKPYPAESTRTFRANLSGLIQMC